MSYPEKFARLPVENVDFRATCVVHFPSQERRIYLGAGGIPERRRDRRAGEGRKAGEWMGSPVPRNRQEVSFL